MIISEQEAVKNGFTHIGVYYMLYVYLKYDENDQPCKYMTVYNDLSFLVDIFYNIELLINKMIEFFSEDYISYVYSFKTVKTLTEH